MRYNIILYMYEYAELNVYILVCKRNVVFLFQIYKYLYLDIQSTNICNNSKSFGFPNQQNKTLKFTKPKSLLSQNAKIWHFERILHHSTKSGKYAKYEGLF